MRIVAFALGTFLALSCTGAPANTIVVPVSVYLAVTPACQVRAPKTVALRPAVTAALQLPAGIVGTVPQVALEMLLANCQTSVRPSLALNDDGRSGAYVATIDF